MKMLCCILTLSVALACPMSQGAEASFSLLVREFVQTNQAAWEARSPHLVDTNNVSFKLLNVITNLGAIRATGTLGGVRPGMTMDQVVALWGKPMELWVKGFGGPRLRYKEVSVFFEPAGDKVKSVFTENLPALLRKMYVSPKVADCVKALGQPDYQDDSTPAGSSRAGQPSPQTAFEQSQRRSAPVMWTFLVYETRETRLKVGCERGTLSTLQLEAAE